MNARKIAAKFAAYAWYEQTRAGRCSQEEVARFVQKNWDLFVPIADEGFGKLLIRIAGKRSKHCRVLASSPQLVGRRRRPSLVGTALAS